MLQQLIEEAADHFNIVSGLFLAVGVWRLEFICFIEGFGELFESNRQQILELKQSLAVQGAYDPDTHAETYRDHFNQ